MNWRASDSLHAVNSCQVNSVPSPTDEIVDVVLELWQTKILALRESVNTSSPGIHLTFGGC
jgi:hypothetical protein